MSHDGLDNLRTWTQPGEGQRRYDYDGSNRLTVVRNAGGAAIIGLGYDVQGNLSIKNGQGYQFDFGNRLRVATSLERYRYDGHGRRSSVIDAVSGKNRHYLYSQGGALAYLWDQGTGERTQYIQLAGSLVAARKVAAVGQSVCATSTPMRWAARWRRPMSRRRSFCGRRTRRMARASVPHRTGWGIPGT
ncbi:RHS repeat domain-containing protein [Stenotrophomonas rhizophila]